jgi:hypothetical protein
MSRAKGKRQVKIEILWGLPASGKTTYALKRAGLNEPEQRGFSSYRPVNVVDLDDLRKKKDLSKSIAQQIRQRENAASSYSNCADHILDGLITTNEDCRRLMEELTYHLDTSVAPAGKPYDLQFWITYWAEDRPACIHNDQCRREVNSKLTILNSPFEVPDPEKLAPFVKPSRIERMVVMTEKRYPSFGKTPRGIPTTKL